MTGPDGMWDDRTDHTIPEEEKEPPRGGGGCEMGLGSVIHLRTTFPGVPRPPPPCWLSPIVRRGYVMNNNGHIMAN